MSATPNEDAAARARLDAAAKRYGFAPEDVGPAFLAQQAEQLRQDYEILADAGLGATAAVRRLGVELERARRLLRRPSKGMRRHVRRMKAAGLWRGRA